MVDGIYRIHRRHIISKNAYVNENIRLTIQFNLITYYLRMKQGDFLLIYEFDKTSRHDLGAR